MSEEFNIFKNLDALRKTNLLDKLKSLEAANNSNDVSVIDDDDFESLLNSNTAKSPVKRRPKKNGKSATIAEKKSKNGKPRRSSTSTDRSLSPTISFLENVGNNTNVDKAPKSGKTRRSQNLDQNSAELSVTDESVSDLQTTTAKTKGKGRGNAAKNTGRGRGKGRGRGRGGKPTNDDESFISNDSLNESSGDKDYEPEEPLDTATNNNGAALNSIMDRFLERGRGGRRRGRSQVMRARRTYIAEVAARSTQVDFIDLVSSPLPRVEGFISLDSDGEDEIPRTRSQARKKKTPKKKPQTEKDASLDISLDDDNPELSVKINWKGKPEAFKLRKYQKFAVIFKTLADRECTDLENMVFNIDDRIVTADDTPDSIDYKIFQFINGRVLSVNFNSPGEVQKKQRNANQINLKIQSDKWKRPLQIDIQKTDKFRILYIKCAEELNVAIDQIKLSFDGEHIELNDSPADLELEGGEVIDLRLKN